MSGWIKICGLNSAAGVVAAVEAGADAVGFVFHPGSPRDVAPAQAAALVREVPAGVLRVAVARHPTQAQVDAILAAFTPDALQTDADDFGHLALPATLGRLPVLRTGQALPATLPARCLYESAQSGRGERADWDAAQVLAGRLELVLAGGLSADNVAAAIGRARPFGVDVSSGVESAPGRKDPARIHAFVSAARRAFAA